MAKWFTVKNIPLSRKDKKAIRNCAIVFFSWFFLSILGIVVSYRFLMYYSTEVHNEKAAFFWIVSLFLSIGLLVAPVILAMGGVFDGLDGPGYNNEPDEPEEEDEFHKELERAFGKRDKKNDLK